MNEKNIGHRYKGGKLVRGNNALQCVLARSQKNRIERDTVEYKIVLERYLGHLKGHTPIRIADEKRRVSVRLFDWTRHPLPPEFFLPHFINCAQDSPFDFHNDHTTSQTADTRHNTFSDVFWQIDCEIHYQLGITDKFDFTGQTASKIRRR